MLQVILFYNFLEGKKQIAQHVAASFACELSDVGHQTAVR